MLFFFFSFSSLLQNPIRVGFWVNVNVSHAFGKRWTIKTRRAEERKLKSKTFTEPKKNITAKFESGSNDEKCILDLNKINNKSVKYRKRERERKIGTCNCARINCNKFSVQTYTRIRTHIHPGIHTTIKTNDSTTVSNKQHHSTYSMCKCKKLLLMWLKIITRMTPQTSGIYFF